MPKGQWGGGIKNDVPGFPSLIVNLPGKPSAIADCLSAVMPAIPYCVDLIGGPSLETDPEICKAFRPKGK